MNYFAQSMLLEAYKLDLFTNGSRPLQPWCFDAETTIVMDWKLRGSGEAEKDLDIRYANAKQLTKKDALKFVCTDPGDFYRAEEVYWEALANDWWRRGEPKVYAGAAFGMMPEADLAELIIKSELNWRLNVQVHQYVWQPNERRR
jgi:organic radical activating enzyme